MTPPNDAAVRSLTRLMGRRRPSLVLVVIFIAIIAGRMLTTERAPDNPVAFDAPATSHVKRVVDGDTLLLTTGERVRLIGIDAPESVKPDSPVEPFGPEASKFLRELVEGRDVRLEFDRERKDQFGRVLAFVYLDGKLVNEEIIRAGFSRAETRFSYSGEMKRRFRVAEEEARDARRGIWSQPPKGKRAA